MVQDLRITHRLVIPAVEPPWHISGASGSGGQGVNATDSGIELVVSVIGLNTSIFGCWYFVDISRGV